MSQGERSCEKPCRMPDSSIENCNVDCPKYKWDGITKPDSKSVIPSNIILPTKNQGYELKDADEYIDTKEGKVISKDELKNTDPFDIMVATAATIGLKLKNPKKDCKHCYGRGYVGLQASNHQPIPCQCVFDKKDVEENPQPFMNHSNKRRIKLEMRRRMRKLSHGELQDILKKKEERLNG